MATLRTPQSGQLTRATRACKRAMLEEVQMPPRFILRVVNRATLASALCVQGRLGSLRMDRR